MKRNKFFMLGIVTVLVAVLSLTFVSNTFAKYTSTVTGSDSARVAKWSWTFEGQDIESWSTDLDLFETAVYEVKNDGTIDLANGQDAQVSVGTAEETIIAPGTGGFIQFEVVNNSEVTATYDLNLTATLNGCPIEFSTANSTNDADWKDAAALALEGTLNPSENATITVFWRWAFTDTVENDLQNKTVTVSVNGNFTQVN